MAAAGRRVASGMLGAQAAQLVTRQIDEDDEVGEEDQGDHDASPSDIENHGNRSASRTLL
jgi:hypothetical protein